ncbi:MAG: response regulator [Verrucomicrobiia bacterium]
MAFLALAEPDPLQREMIANLLQLIDPKRGVFQAETAAQVLAMVEDHKIDLVITELRLPDSDGLELVTRIHHLDPPIPVIALTEHPDDFRHGALLAGAASVIGKPIDADLLETEVHRLLRLHTLKPLYNIALEGVLQMVSAQNRDCVLQILSEEQKGRFIFQDGNLVHASTPPLTGLEAVRAMMGWTIHHFSTSPLRHPVTPNLHGSLVSVLLDAAVQNDEASGDSINQTTHHD